MNVITDQEIEQSDLNEKEIEWRRKRRCKLWNEIIIKGAKIESLGMKSKKPGEKIMNCNYFAMLQTLSTNIKHYKDKDTDKKKLF